MNRAIREFFRDDERASRKLLAGTMFVMVISFVGAVAAIFWLK